jgi:flavin reductase (DIM6/NTAB) family NADH-FMN oxidoreductase RutF
MERKSISLEQLTTRPVGLWEPGWFLLTSGDFAAGQFNAMTVSWGGMGVLWNKPVVQVVVRPQRYTFQFMEQYPTFTLCAFPPEYRAALNLLGTKSGREGDKIREAGLMPVASGAVPAPAYAEAELVFCCRKIYWQDLDPEHFLDPAIDRNYPRRDYHRAYFGEIVAAFGTSNFAE